MTEKTDQTEPVAHASFTLERVYSAAPARVFAAFADPAAKAAWFGGDDGKWTALRREMDFRVGGHEVAEGQWQGGIVTRFDAVYHDIVPDRRIVYSYGMHIDDTRISVSLATIEIRPEGAGTRLVITEQGAFLDGYEDAGSRERGTAELLDKIGRSLER
jgi:uncharacterized protein YndB with AHSA1/START domain